MQSVRAQEPVNAGLSEFQRLLRLEAGWLGYLAQQFWGIERIFSQHDGRGAPIKKQLSSEFLNYVSSRQWSDWNFRVQTIPERAVRIDYVYDPAMKAWQKKVSPAEYITLTEYQSRISQCKTAIDKCCAEDTRIGADKLELTKLASAFLSRQIKFHGCESTHRIPRQTPQSIPYLIQQLAEYLKTFNALTNGFGYQAPQQISEEVAALLEENQQLTPVVCGRILLAIFVGRYISTEKGELHAIVGEYINKIASICFEMHGLFHPLSKEFKQVPPQAQQLPLAAPKDMKQSNVPVVAGPVAGIQQTGQIQQALQIASAQQAQPTKLIPAAPSDVRAAPAQVPGLAQRGMVWMQVTPEEQAKINADRESATVTVTMTKEHYEEFQRLILQDLQKLNSQGGKLAPTPTRQ